MSTKEKLIRSAFRLFNEKGFEATSTTSICSDAGFSSGALFVHFKTKNDLLDFLYVDTKKKYFQYVFSKIETGVSFEEKFKKILYDSFEFYLKNYDEYIFVKRFASSPHISRIAKNEIEKETQAFMDLYEEGKQLGFFINGNYELIIAMQSAMFYQGVEYAKHNGKEYINEIISMIMNIIKV